MSTSDIRGIRLFENELFALAGEPLQNLLNKTNQNKNRHLNYLAGIPGTLGGAIALNAGILERSIGEDILEVGILDNNNQTKILASSGCDFEYRSSVMLREHSPILWARLDLHTPPSYSRSNLLAKRKHSQPTAVASAGCVFRNPSGMSAGKLIEQTGLKGFRLGMAKVSEKHGNFILNLGGATSAEIRRLIDIVRGKVYKSSHVSLELELEVVKE